MVEHKLQLALPSLLDGPVFLLLAGGSKNPSLLVARIVEDDGESGVCFFVGKGAGPEYCQAAYRALQLANDGKFNAVWSDVETVVLSKETSDPAIFGMYAALLAVDPTWRTSDDVARICAGMDAKANTAALASIVRVLEPCSTRKDQSSLGQRVRETELENATLKNKVALKDNQLIMKDNLIAALNRRIKKLSEEAVAAQTVSTVLRVKLYTMQPNEFDRSKVMVLMNTTHMSIVPTKPLTN